MFLGCLGFGFRIFRVSGLVFCCFFRMFRVWGLGILGFGVLGFRVLEFGV